MTMGFYDTAQKDITKWEGSIPHMYVDTNGYVTVGIGFMIPNAGAAKGYNFVKRSDGKKASDKEKEEEWKKVKKLTKGKKASAYKAETTLDLPDSDIKKLLLEKIKSFESGIKGIYSDYDKYPDELKLALMDIAFNTGVDGLKKFSKMKKAIDEKRWTDAATESKRSKGRAERNKYVYDLIIEAGKKMPAPAAATP
jgi:GH24 family phage-related lysozyme (muramidase)